LWAYTIHTKAKKMEKEVSEIPIPKNQSKRRYPISRTMSIGNCISHLKKKKIKKKKREVKIVPIQLPSSFFELSRKQNLHYNLQRQFWEQG
jgi:hypothetical protein